MRQELRRVGSHPGSQPRGLRGYLPRDLGCCGLPFRSLGDEDTAARLMDKCLRQLSITGADGIFIVCSSCAFAFRQAGKRTSGPTAILDIHELLVKIGAMTARQIHP